MSFLQAPGLRSGLQSLQSLELALSMSTLTGACLEEVLKKKKMSDLIPKSTESYRADSDIWFAK